MDITAHYPTIIAALIPAFIGLIFLILWLSKRAQFSALDSQLQQKINENEQHRQTTQKIQHENTQLQIHIAQLKNNEHTLKKHHESQLHLLSDNKQKLSEAFELVANRIFTQQQAQNSSQNQQQLGQLLAPFREQIDAFKRKVEDVHHQDSKDRATLVNELKHLQDLNVQITKEASKLSTALKGDKKTQGNWGELILESILERSGLRRGFEFDREVSIRNEEGKLYRPDVIIYLPDNKHIVVDSKVSLNAYNHYVNSEDKDEQKQFLDQHVQAIRHHIHDLAGKDYQHLPGLSSPDMVFMFMPIEPAFIAAFSHDEELFNDAFDQKIIIVTPTTLLASLKTVANLWESERQNENAQLLAERASKIYSKLVGFVETIEQLGERIGKSQESYDKALSQLKTGRGNLISQASQFERLGVRIKKPLPTSVTESAEIENL
jgi:DNA recombination protein RmuC